MMTRIENVRIQVNGISGKIQDFPDLILETHNESPTIYSLVLRNIGTEKVRIDQVEFAINLHESSSRNDQEARFYKEGLTAVGVAGARGAGEADFELDPNFLKFTTSNPNSYDWETPGVFHAEQVGLVFYPKTNIYGLIGFVTARDYFCRVTMDMRKNTNHALTARVETCGKLLAPDSVIQLESLMIMSGANAESLLKSYADETAERMKARPLASTPTGWCSYYFYYGQETESDIIENARYLAEHRETIPVEYIQIDDGWQKARGDWLENNQEKFPGGMKKLAGKIIDLGFKAGIWVAPFLLDEQSEIYKYHCDWLLKDHQDAPLKMGDNYILDPTHPDAVDWLKNCFQTLKHWGYSYFKLDFLIVATCFGANYHDRNATGLQAYRRGLKAIRDAVGDESFILAGTALITPSIGLVDACRISTDVTPYWARYDCTPESPAIFNVCRNIVNRNYMNRRFWINDPDCLIVREKHGRAKYADIPSLTLAEVRMLATAMIMSGGSLFLGDKMSKLSPERLKIIKTVFELRNDGAAFPVDRMETDIPCVWLKRGDGTQANPHLVAFFNWTEKQKIFTISLKTLGFESTETLQILNVWENERVLPDEAVAGGEISLPPHSCELFSMTRQGAIESVESGGGYTADAYS